MRRFLLAIYCLIFCLPLYSQYYLRGEIRDQQGHPLPGVKINLSSKGSYPFYTGSSGGFGIPVAAKIDTITISAEGFETIKTVIQTTVFASFALKVANAKLNSSKLRLSSLTKNLITYEPYTPTIEGESYSSTVENDFVETKKFPETGFALNVDRASYSNIRRFLNLKIQAPKEAVRVEELLNYFNFTTKKYPENGETFAVDTKLTSCPWNGDNQLLFINLKAKKLNLENTPASNLVFLIDVSGSMQDTNKLPLLKTSFKLLAENLRPIDTVSIITYGSSVSVQLTPTGGDRKQKIIEAIEGLTPAGSTPGASAIKLAYNFANNTFIKGGNNRVILATDGDFNVGQTTEKELEELITAQRQTGIYLTCLGVGMGNYKDSKLEALAKKGNGNFAYLDSEKEAEKVLVEEFAQTLYTVANDVYLTSTFNPEYVKEYRLIGFDNPRNAIADTTVELEGGEVGSGHSMMAVFEIVPVQASQTIAEGNFATITVSFELPSNNQKKEKQTFLVPAGLTDIAQADSCFGFASSVIMFGGILKESKYCKDVEWDEVLTLAQKFAKKEDLLQNEFLQLIEKAKSIYPRKKKK